MLQCEQHLDCASAYSVNDLYAGERWIVELAAYDLRNRFMSPELGRFLQSDPIGFKGDASNLYRYCHNDPEDFSDPMGLFDPNTSGGWPYSPLTSFGGGDWIKGSDGLSASDWNHKHDQAGTDRGGGGVENGGDAGAGGGGKSMAPEHEGPKSANAEAQMRFVPTKLAKDGITALPTKSDHSGSEYEYQFSTSSNPPRRVSGVGVIVLEKLEHISGVKVGDYQQKPAPLQSNGIFPDRVGLGWRPGNKDNGLRNVATNSRR